MPKPNRIHKSGTPNGGGQIVNLTGLKKKLRGASPSILEAYRQLEALNGGAVGSLTTNTQRVVEPTRPRAMPPPLSAVSDLRSLLRTATDGAKKPVPKINRSAARKASAVARTEPWRDIFLNQFPVATSTGEYARRHPLVPRTMEEIQEYLENQDELKRNALSNIPAEPARILQSLVTHQPDVETHLANPELTKDDNALTNYGGLLVGGISEAKEARARGKSEFLRITTPEIAKQVAVAMRWKGPWTDYLNPKSRAVREYRHFIRGGRVRSNYEDDPAALAMTSGSGRQLASIMAGDKDLQNASILGLLGRGASLVISPSRALAVYAGDLRGAEDIPTWEQGFNAVFDSGTQLLTGAAVERLGLSLGERALAKTGIGGLLKGSAAQSSESAIQQGLKGYLAGAGKAAVRSWANNQAYQLLPTLGQASDLSQKNGKSLAQNFGRLSLEGTVGMLRPYDPRVLADPNVSAYEKAQILLQHGLSLYHNRDKAFNLVAKWAKANRVDPRVVRRVADDTDRGSRGGGSGPNEPYEGIDPKGAPNTSKREQATVRQERVSQSAERKAGGSIAKQAPTPPTGMPYYYLKAGPEKTQLAKSDLARYEKYWPRYGSFDIATTMVDRAKVGRYFNPETGAAVDMFGGHDAAFMNEHYGRFAMSNQEPAAQRLIAAAGHSNGLVLAYLGAPDSVLSSSHSAKVMRAEIEAALKNGRASTKEVLELIQHMISINNIGLMKKSKNAIRIPHSLEDFYALIDRDAMVMEDRKSIAERLFSGSQTLLPHKQTLIRNMTSEHLLGGLNGDIVAALHIDPHGKPVPSSSTWPYSHLVPGIHLGETQRVNIREALAESYQRIYERLKVRYIREGIDPALITDGIVYRELRYDLDRRKGANLLGRTNAAQMGRLVHGG